MSASTRATAYLATLLLAGPLILAACSTSSAHQLDPDPVTSQPSAAVLAAVTVAPSPAEVAAASPSPESAAPTSTAAAAATLASTSTPTNAPTASTRPSADAPTITPAPTVAPTSAATLAPTPVPTPVPTAKPPTGTAGTVNVTLTNVAIVVSASSASAGTVTFQIHNSGSVPHDFDVLKTTFPQDQIPNDPSQPGKVIEPGLLASARNIPAGGNAKLTLDLSTGAYVFICDQPAHYLMGMHTAFTVTAP